IRGDFEGLRVRPTAVAAGGGADRVPGPPVIRPGLTAIGREPGRCKARANHQWTRGEGPGPAAWTTRSGMTTGRAPRGCPMTFTPNPPALPPAVAAPTAGPPAMAYPPPYRPGPLPPPWVVAQQQAWVAAQQQAIQQQEWAVAQQQAWVAAQQQQQAAW